MLQMRMCGEIQFEIQFIQNRQMRDQGQGDWRAAVQMNEPFFQQRQKWKKLEERVQKIQTTLQQNNKRVKSSHQLSENLQYRLRRVKQVVDLSQIEIDNLSKQISHQKQRSSMIEKLLRETRQQSTEKISTMSNRLRNELEEIQENRNNQTYQRVVELCNQMLGAKNKLEELMEKIGKKQFKSSLHDITDFTTPFASNFRIEGDRIQLEEEVGKGFRKQWQQILLDQVLTQNFSFRVRIENKRGSVMVGVVDRLSQKEKGSSWESGNAICYYGGSPGAIYSGKGSKGQYEYKETRKSLENGTELLVQINMLEGSVCFTIRTLEEIYNYEIRSPILKQKNRQFVPYAQMLCKGDAITFHVE